MIAEIRPTTSADFPSVMQVYEAARSIMRQNGNLTQWVGGYPQEDIVRGDMEKGWSFVCLNEQGNIVGTFCLMTSDEPTYAHIYDGKWVNDEPYATIHRLASSGQEKGVAKACFDWSFRHYPNIRVDTHRDNRIMRSFLEKEGFAYCGIIYLKDGAERLAYQKVVGKYPFFTCYLGS